MFILDITIVFILYFLININEALERNVSSAVKNKERVMKVREIGYFWHVADVFFDPYYSVLGSPESDCHVAPKQNFTRNCGFFGEFEQCSSFGLVNSIGRMMNLRSKNRTNFYIFTGNVRCPYQIQNSQMIYETMRAFVTNIQDSGLNASIYPSYGWYDYHPFGHHPTKYTTFYSKMSEILRDQWESSAFLQSRWNFGYFSYVQRPYSNLRVIVLNTNYYIKKHVASQSADPSGQWSWLIKQLRDCRLNRQKAYIVMSVPPGVEDIEGGLFRTSEELSWAQKHNKRYLGVIRTFYDVIVAQFASHRSDTFRLIYSKYEKLISFILLSPSIQPHYSNLPSVRMYMYDMKSTKVVDYVQYYFNMSWGNDEMDRKSSEKYWKVRYNFRDHYALPDLSLYSLETLLARMAKGNIFFKRFIKATRAMQYGGDICFGRCKMVMMCLITNIELTDFFECISGSIATIDGRIEDSNDLHQSGRDYMRRYLSPSGSAMRNTISIILLIFCFLVTWAIITRKISI
ncbi:acid sphingomyelinase-like phosphodiesterase 3b [Cephus cinctus]|uniref:Acid sphingomyelinase-like phosphodiesterase 3b n=1 Tax=Cephus cinctus TaxID=211228 RepID=A0AAJ7RVL4_CEPCN|nr:acid sphingomyelinase-like phosphodiesterase 3b [Cephus cinctus]